MNVYAFAPHPLEKSAADLPATHYNENQPLFYI